MEQPRGDTVTHAHALESLGFSLPRRVEIGLVVTTDTVVANLELFGIVGVHTGDGSDASVDSVKYVMVIIVQPCTVEDIWLQY